MQLKILMHKLFYDLTYIKGIKLSKSSIINFALINKYNTLKKCNEKYNLNPY